MDGQIYPTYKIPVLSEELALSNIDVASLLDGTGIEPNAIHSAATRISRRQLIAAYVNASRLCPEPGLGLRAGKRLRLSAYGMYGYALVSSANRREALEFSIRYHELATPTVRMSLRLDDDSGTAIFSMEDLLDVDGLAVLNLELQFSLVLSLFRDMLGETFRFDEIRATFPEPSYIDQYTARFSCPVIFDSRHNELRFDEWWLQKPLLRANPITSEMLHETCDRILLDMKTSVGVAHQVYEILSADLRHAGDIETIAGRLDMTGRTLRRKLTQEGTSFQHLLRDVRTQFAIAFLRDTHMTVDDIADRLGFSDAANFRHAFKSWTGKVPSSYRGSR